MLFALLPCLTAIMGIDEAVIDHSAEGIQKLLVDWKLVYVSLFVCLCVRACVCCYFPFLICLFVSGWEACSLNDVHLHFRFYSFIKPERYNAIIGPCFFGNVCEQKI